MIIEFCGMTTGGMPIEAYPVALVRYDDYVAARKYLNRGITIFYILFFTLLSIGGFFFQMWKRNQISMIEKKENGKNNTKFYLEETTVTSNNRDTQTINTENAVVNHFVIAGEQAMSSAKAETVIIVWTHQSVSYTLITYYLSYDEALKIAEGIQQK